jgi:fumarate reductase flavoprotein subunit
MSRGPSDTGRGHQVSKDYDLIVVGAGTAGVPAALGAVARGLKVCLVEAADEIGGTLRLSSASISAAGVSIQSAAGVADDRERHFRDCLRINHGTGDHALLRSWVDQAGEAVDWLLSIGWTCTPNAPVFAPEHDLYETPRTYRSSNQGLSLIDAYEPQVAHAIETGRLDLLLNTRFRTLVTDAGRVTGVVAERNGEDLELRARAVALTTGGFSGSARHWQELHGVTPLRYHVPTVVGDALDPVRAIGGALWFEDYVLPAFGGTRDIGSPAAAWIHSVVLPSIRPPWEIYVNSRGERFMPEDEPSIDARERAVMAQPGWSFWCIYDDAIRETAPPLFRWPAGKLQQLFAGADEDYIVADTLEDLARRCAIPPEALKRTVDLYNRGQAVGSDMWRRKHLPAPLSRGPFYAVRHYGCAISTYPGVKVDLSLRALRADGSVIEGLYAAGEVIGIGFLGHGFLSGSIVSAAVSFGRQLGREVLA